MTRRVLAALVAVTLVVSTVPVVTDAATPEEQVIGSPDLELSAPDNRFGPSERGALTVVVSNGGDVRTGGPGSFTNQVTTARNVRVSVVESEVDAPIEFKSGTALLGSVTTARPATATFQLETGEDLKPGTYRVPIRLEYDYTRIVTYEQGRSGPQDPDFSDSFRERTEHVEIVVERASQFAVESSTTAVYAGDTGLVNVSVTNTGTETARDATLQLTSGSPSVYFGPQTNPQQSTSVFVSELRPGESANASVEVGATAETTPGSYPVEARVVYENDNGVTTKSDRMPAEVRVNAERRFSVESLETERFRVGEEDVVVTGEVVNHGPAPARNAVVKLAAGSSSSSVGGSGSGGAPGGSGPGGAPPTTGGSPGPIRVTSAESGVGTLDPGDSHRVQFKLAVSEDAEPGSQTLNFVVEYENADGDLRQSSMPIRESVEVGEELDTFAVVDRETTVTAGGSAALQVTLKNTGEETVRDANAKLFVNDPLSAPDNSAFLGEVDPGETTTATFKIEADGGAQAKEYAGSVEVRYEDESGDSELADGLQVGVPVAPSSGGLPLTYVGLGLGVVVLTGGVYTWRRS